MTITGQEPLAGTPTPRKRSPREWGIELTPIGALPRDPAPSVRVTLIDRETGKRVGSRVIPWTEFRDVRHSTVLANIAEGVHE